MNYWFDLKVPQDCISVSGVCPSLTCSRKYQVLKNGSVPLWKCQETPTELNPSARVIFTPWKETDGDIETFSFSTTLNAVQNATSG